MMLILTKKREWEHSHIYKEKILKLLFGAFIHKSQIVMELDVANKTDNNIAKKIMQHKPVTSIQHFIAGEENEIAAVIIWDGLNLVRQIIGKWEFDHTVNKRISYTNYFRFTPQFDIKSFALETVDAVTDELYLYYTFNKYNKL